MRESAAIERGLTPRGDGRILADVSPTTYLLACLIITAAALGVYIVTDALRRAKLKRLAEQSEMHFSPIDRFKLAAEVARRFPVVGAADPKVSDLLYSRRDDRVWYVFRFEYTVGVTGPKLRRRAVVGFIEPRDRDGGEATKLVIAQPGEVVGQYKEVLQALSAETELPLSVIREGVRGENSTEVA